MALVLTFSNGKPASMARGRYSTRNNRVVEITGSHVVTEHVGGQDTQKTIWDGVIYEANGKNVESKATWSNDGRYLHNEGVGSSFDLSIVISQETEPEPAPAAVATEVKSDPAVLENQILCAALVARLSDVVNPADENPMATLERVISERDTAQEQVRELLAK